MSCGASQPPVTFPPAQPVTARRVTSVLFGDLVGFTTLSESRDQEEARDLLSRFFDGCRQIVDRYGGTVEKFIGDAVMAVWGVPTAHEDDAERAVRAGLELVQSVAALGDDLGVPGLAMRVGIVTGEVAVNVGAEGQGMVAGDAVNTASRIQSAADAGQIWVDEATRALTSAAISYADAGSHALKGKAEPVQVWSAESVIGSIGGGQRADGLEAPFVGRDRELRVVKELFHFTGDSLRPALIVVEGEAGIGKSRLGWEFFKYIDGLTRTTYWHQGRCLAYGEGVSYYALSEAVRMRLTLAGGDGDAGVDQLITNGLAAVVEDPDELEWLHPRIAALLGVGSVGTFAREDLFSAWSTFFERVSSGDPLVLMVDDAQHADDGLLTFLEYLLEAASFPCLVVLMARPGLLQERPTLATNRRATVLHLPSLAPRDMSVLVNGLVSGLPDGVTESLVERAEGVPLYAVETVRSLIDRDLVLPRGGRYVLSETSGLDLSTIGAPASLQALIAARLDTLSAAQRRVVNAASIFASSFELEALAQVCPDVDVEQIVGDLTRLQFLSKDTHRLSSEFGQIKFVQSAVRQVAYGTLSRRDRKAGHLAAARHFEASPEAGHDFDGVIAQHYIDAKQAMPGDADVPELERAAVSLLLSAADWATTLGAPGEAAAHLAHALDQVTDAAERGRLASRLAWALYDAGNYDASIEHAERATVTLDELGDEVGAGISAAAGARSLVAARGDHTRALEMCAPRLAALRDRADAVPAVLKLGRVVTAAESALGVDERDTIDLRLRLSDRVGDAGELAEAFTSLSLYYLNRQAQSAARVLMGAAADLAREHHLLVPLARALVNLNADHNGTDLREAIDFGTEAVAVSLRTGVAWISSAAQANLVLALWTAGRWSELDDLLSDASALLSSNLWPVARVPQLLVAAARGAPTEDLDASVESLTSDDPGEAGWLQFADAVHELVDGDRKRALDEMVVAVRSMYAVSTVFDDFPHVWPIAVQLALELGEAEMVTELLSLVDDFIGVGTPLSVRAHRRRFAGLVAMTDGSDPAIVERALREAIDDFDRWGSAQYRARTQADLGRWLVAQDRAPAAEPLLAAARSTYAEMGATAWLAALEGASAASV